MHMNVNPEPNKSSKNQTDLLSACTWKHTLYVTIQDHQMQVANRTTAHICVCSSSSDEHSLLFLSRFSCVSESPVSGLESDVAP